MSFVTDWKPTNGPFCALSKVSSLIAFQRCPNLTVTLITGDERLEQGNCKVATCHLVAVLLGLIVLGIFYYSSERFKALCNCRAQKR